MGMKIAFAGMNYAGLPLDMLLVQHIVKRIKAKGLPADVVGKVYTRDLYKRA